MNKKILALALVGAALLSGCASVPKDAGQNPDDPWESLNRQTFAFNQGLDFILIRPLAYVEEKDIIKYAEMRKFPIIPCNLCGSQENLQRAMLNDMLRQWDKDYPKRLHSIFGALQNVSPSQLADRELFDFEALDSEREFDFKQSCSTEDAAEGESKRINMVNLGFAAD